MPTRIQKPTMNAWAPESGFLTLIACACSRAFPFAGVQGSTCESDQPRDFRLELRISNAKCKASHSLSRLGSRAKRSLVLCIWETRAASEGVLQMRTPFPCPLHEAEERIPFTSFSNSFLSCLLHSQGSCAIANSSSFRVRNCLSFCLKMQIELKIKFKIKNCSI